MIRSFRDRGSRENFEGQDTARARRRLPVQLWERARVKLDRLNVATRPGQLNTPSNRLEKLVGDRRGQYSVRIDRQYRICFRWVDGDAWDVEITDYH